MLRQKKKKQKKNKERVPQRGFKEAQVLAVVNKGEKRTSTKQEQGGTRFGQWRIQRWRIIRVRSLKSLSRNIALFGFLRSHSTLFISLLTADISRNEALAASLCESLLNHEPGPRALVTWRNELVSKAWPRCKQKTLCLKDRQPVKVLKSLNDRQSDIFLRF